MLSHALKGSGMSYRKNFLMIMAVTRDLLSGQDAVGSFLENEFIRL